MLFSIVEHNPLIEVSMYIHVLHLAKKVSLILSSLSQCMNDPGSSSQMLSQTESRLYPCSKFAGFCLKKEKNKYCDTFQKLVK